MRPSPLAVLALLPLLASAGRGGPAWGPDPGVFASHMVLASNDTWRGGSTPARVWGAGTPGESITLSGLPAGAAVTPSNPWTVPPSGNWSITVSVAASLSAFNLTFTGAKESVEIDDVLFGHTILCSGQCE
jgi:hypothetical protein